MAEPAKPGRRSLFDRLAARYANVAVPCEVTFPDGSVRRFGEGQPAFHVALKNQRAIRAVSSLDEGKIADAYVYGDIDIEGDMLKPFELKTGFKDFHPVTQAWRFIQPLLFGQVRTDKAHIHTHYDIHEDFFLSFLDPEVPCYTQGVYLSDDEPLSVAGARKLEYCFDRLRLKPGDHLLEIGPGWGAWFEYASKRGVKCTGLSIAQSSIDYLNSRSKLLGYDWELIFSDLLEYETEQKYDAIVIMGVIEHLPDYEKVLTKFSKLLKPGGRVFLDGSACDRKFELPSFMVKHIYGGNHSFLTLPDFMDKLTKTPLKCLEIFNDSRSYFLTLVQWAKNIDAHRDEVIRRFGDYNFRRFRLYLWGSAQAFLTRDMGAWRMILELPATAKLDVA